LSQGYSQIELRKQLLESFDFIYAVGSHDVDAVLEDGVPCLRLLKRGGIIIFDGYKWAGWNKVEPPENVPRSAIDIFYAVNGRQFEVLHSGCQVILRKK
jgi:predicted O-methyltransferase YrrM